MDPTCPVYGDRCPLQMCGREPGCSVAAASIEAFLEGDEAAYEPIPQLLVFSFPMARNCPDGGTCHHKCVIWQCFRVHTCGPLSGFYEDDEWPDEVVAEYAPRYGGRL